MAVQGKADESEVSYEEFDSNEFEANQPTIRESKDSDAKDAATDSHVEGEKLTPEQAFGGEESEKTEETTEETADVVSDDAPAKVEESAYEPNLKYTAYGQEKEFPEQLKTLVKDKDTEEYFRGLLSKADGLDEMKPRHQEVVQHRDELKSQVDYFKKDINRVLTLRDKQPHLFAAELSITDDWIIDRAKEIVNAKENPEQYETFKKAREKDFDLYTRELTLQNQQQLVSTSTGQNIAQQMQVALSEPEVAGFVQKFDTLHGPGAFQREVMKHGYYHYEHTKQSGKPENLAPLDAVKQVFEFHKKTFAPAVTQVESKPAATGARTVVVKEKPKALPNLGKGKTASPVQPKFKNLKQMREYVDKHVPAAE